LRIVIPTTGSQGDLHPYLALGVGLRVAGHDVCLATHTDFGPLIQQKGLEFFPIGGSSRDLHASREGLRMQRAGQNPFAFMRHFAQTRKPLMIDLMAGLLEACREADLLLVGTTAFLPGHSVAEKLKIPAFNVHYVPTSQTTAFAHCLAPELPSWLPGRPLYNWLSYAVVGEYFWQQLGSAVNHARDQVLGLPPLPLLGPPPRLFKDLPTLYGYSPQVIPRPVDWPSHHVIVGHWFLESSSDYCPPAALVKFLDEGPPAISIGFSGMQNGRTEEVTELVTQALARCGQRGVVLTGWGGLCAGRASDQVFFAEAVPHDWLFPRVAAVVHHGGAGSTAQALRAGVPAVVAPFMADQPFWGRQIARLGVGPEPILQQQLTVERLARAIHQAVSDEGMRTRAAELGRKVRAEDGVGAAVDALHAFLTPSLAYMDRRQPLRIPDFNYTVRRRRPLLSRETAQPSGV
jgi:UDP:flavonoid glycosyltransferase YjiC (YdhE family)